LVCENIQELPLLGYDGFYDGGVIIDSNDFTTIPADSFPGISTNRFQITSNANLTTIEPGFLNGIEDMIEILFIAGDYELKKFPFEDMAKFTKLQEFAMISTGMESFPSNIPWPNTLYKMEYMGNSELHSIEPYAFSNAEGLQLLDLRGSGAGLHTKSNGFHSKSNLEKTLTISDFDSETKYDSNAFGNVDGGKLWTVMNVPSVDFPEDVFRLLLKTHFDKGHQTLLTTSGGPNMVDNCMSSCDIAWLYKDAHMFGINAYKGLIGPNNVICSDVGPILESQDPEFIAFMDNCPYTEIPWPGPNVCEDIVDPNQDITSDPESCQCYYLCSGQQIHGHECCPNGLVFNPEILNCDWPFNVPNCDV